MKKLLRNLMILGVSALATAAVLGQANSAAHENWVSTWSTSQDMAPSVMERPVLPPGMKLPDFSKMPKRPSPNIPTNVENQTLRMIVHTSIGGRKVRIELANAFGRDVVSIGSAHVAVRTTGSSIESRTDHPVTFGGAASIDLRPGVILVSDPIDLDVAPTSDLAVSLFVVKAPGTPTNHTLGLHTSYIASGDKTSAATLTDATMTTAYMWLRSIDVAAPPSDFAIVCFGDSITDGFTTTVDKDQAWPTLLANRLHADKGAPAISVLNEGISGNQVLRDGAGVSGLARFDRDVLTHPGVRWVILLEGINDINIHGQIVGPGAMSPEDLIAGYRQLIARAHMQRVRIAGATLTPDAGIWLAGPVGEATRQKVNEWIKTSGEFDAVIDFDAATRNPANPTHLKAEYDSGDHIHPNDIGNAAMANAIPLDYFLSK
jgi:lysophospholipase L1-like esterase